MLPFVAIAQQLMVNEMQNALSCLLVHSSSLGLSPFLALLAASSHHASLALHRASANPGEVLVFLQPRRTFYRSVFDSLPSICLNSLNGKVDPGLSHDPKLAVNG
jgi:hypothetical protein